jgi:hypothetical protein
MVGGKGSDVVQYFRFIVAVSFIDEGNRSTLRNPTTCKLNYHNMAKTTMAPVVNPGNSTQ